MAARPAPVIYLVYGDDDLAISRFIAELEGKLGDPSLAVMNVTRLDAAAFDPNTLLEVASAMPFLAPRRLVILEDVLARLAGPAEQEIFKAAMMKIPETTALVVVEHRLLSGSKGGGKKKPHWFEQWAEQVGDRAYVKALLTPRGSALVPWVQDCAIRSGGKITAQASSKLIELVGENPRQIDQEIQKLLAYVNYSRPVEVDDVQALTADSVQGNIFVMVDALGERDGKTASAMLLKLLEDQDPLQIFAMIVRQFRMLIQFREALDRSYPPGDLARELNLPSFVAEKMGRQARRFTMPALERVHHYLLDIDEEFKSSQVEPAVALQALVVTLTLPG